MGDLEDWLARFVPAISFDDWQIAWLRGMLERTLPDDPPDLDTWEGEGGALAAERPSGPMRSQGMRADLIIIDEWRTMEPPPGVFAELIDLEAMEYPPACTRYPVCDDPELPDDQACIWPSCALTDPS